MREQFSLYRLITALQSCRPNVPIIYDFGIYPANAASYRGDYSELAFGFKSEPTTVQELLDVASAALGAVFEGYKGGQYYMGKNTRVWASAWGYYSGLQIVGLRENKDSVTILTQHEDGDGDVEID